MTENLTIFPSRQRIELNDKATKFLFNQTDSRFLKMVGGEAMGRITEKRNHGKKHETLRSGYTLQTSNGFTFIAALDEYDRAVLNVCVTEYENGAEYITLAAIQRALSGKNCEGDNGSRICKNQFARLKQAIDKLMACQYDPDILKVYEELNYEGAETVEKAQILPAERLKKRIGGKVIDVLRFRDASPLLKIAKIKKQLLTYDAELLDVPDQNNTPLVIALKNYTLRRVLEIKQHHKQLKPILTLDDIFKKARIDAKDRKTKLRARDYLDVFFKHLQEKGVIKSFEWTKKGNKFYSIKFNF